MVEEEFFWGHGTCVEITDTWSLTKNINSILGGMGNGWI